MRTPLAEQVRQVAVTDPIVTGHRYDYADAFEIGLPEAEQEVPEAWVRAGMEDTPAWVDWIAVALLGVRETSDAVAGGRVVESTPEVVHLEYALPLMQVVVVGRRVGSSGRMLTTGLRFTRPRLARLVWVVVGPGHRWMVQRLLAGHLPSAMASRNGDPAREA